MQNYPKKDSRRGRGKLETSSLALDMPSSLADVSRANTFRLSHLPSVPMVKGADNTDNIIHTSDDANNNDYNDSNGNDNNDNNINNNNKLMIQMMIMGMLLGIDRVLAPPTEMPVRPPVSPYI